MNRDCDSFAMPSWGAPTRHPRAINAQLSGLIGRIGFWRFWSSLKQAPVNESFTTACEPLPECF